jgi:hypothetical protein
MNERVKGELARNRKHYEKLTLLNPYFSMKLFSPNNHFTSQQCTTASLNLMIRQLDLLLEDGHLLEKEIKKTELRKMQSEYLKSEEADAGRHHFAYLRKIWLSSSEADARNPLERLEQLNKKVVLVKNNLYSLTDSEKKSYDRNHLHSGDYAGVLAKISEVVQHTKEYSLLKEKHEGLSMAYEELQHRYMQLKASYAEAEAEKNEVVRKLRQENE